MYRASEYSVKLMELFRQKGISSTNYRHLMITKAKVNKAFQKLEYNKDLIKECEEMVGKTLENIVKMHAAFFKLLRKTFGLKEDESRVQMAIEYSLMGCVVDKLLDAKETDNKEQYIDYLKRFSLIEYDENALGNALNDLWKSINRAYMQNVAPLSRMDLMIRECVAQAHKSEVFTATHSLKSYNVKKSDVIDKSVKFTMAGILMALSDIPEAKFDEVNGCAADIGTVFCLVDDLVDFYVDIREEQVSSLVRNERDEDLQLERLIDDVIDHLEEYIETVRGCFDRLQNHLSVECFEYIHFITDSWIGDYREEESA